MNKPFWTLQIATGISAYYAQVACGRKKDTHSSPVWCFNRLGGATRTKLPDGRIICIGGAYEDDLHPDFCIYNGKTPFYPP